MRGVHYVRLILLTLELVEDPGCVGPPVGPLGGPLAVVGPLELPEDEAARQQVQQVEHQQHQEPPRGHRNG